jgi:hypothetical protein
LIRPVDDPAAKQGQQQPTNQQPVPPSSIESSTEAPVASFYTLAISFITQTVKSRLLPAAPDRSFFFLIVKTALRHISCGETWIL